MAVIRETLTVGQRPTNEQIREVRLAATMPICYDDDCPELTDRELSEFRRVADTTADERKRIAVEGARRERVEVTVDPEVKAWLNTIDDINGVLRDVMKLTRKAVAVF